MVFCGKPSKACRRCRERRLRCDLRTDSCGQCLRAGTICSGYRDTNLIRFRDESENVRKKALAKVVYPPHETLPQTISVPLDLRAREAFFGYYVTGASSAWGFLWPFYDQTRAPAHLELAIEAVSLAYLSHQAESNAALVTGRERYAAALGLMNQALQSAKTAATEATLFAALLLDLFEKITNTNRASHVEAWSSHVKGALGLVRLRGLDQFRDPGALRVLVRLSINYVISCVANEIPVPPEVLKLREHASVLFNTKEPKWRLTEAAARTTNLRSDLRNGRISVPTAINRAMELDRTLENIAHDAPEFWLPNTIHLSHPSNMVFEDYFEMYSNYHVTQTWNVIRSTRIILNGFIIGNLPFLEDNTSADQIASAEQSCRGNIDKCVRGICATAPQYLDCKGILRQQAIPETNMMSSNSPGECREAASSHTGLERIQCYSLIFPLYSAARMAYDSKDLRLWAISQLNYIASHFGIKNASAVAQLLEKNHDVDIWTVYAMLGGYAFSA